MRRNSSFNRCLIFALVPILSLAVLPLTAQSIIVKGKVISAEDNQSVPGVNIILKDNPAMGTVTDLDGNYSISVPYDSAVLVFSFVGHTTVEQRVGGRSVIDVTLNLVSTALEDVVVIGYGTQVQKDLTGAVATVKEKEFNKGNFASPDQLIQGRIAGIQITNTSGQPGVATTIKIRGNSVLTGTGQPLFVVDGVPLSGTTARPNADDFNGSSSPAGNPLNFLNPADIASIDVLKDASAAAIYGSRGAYGVVMITTKKATTGEPRIDVALSTGLASVQNKIVVLNPAQFRDAIKYYGASATNDKGGDSDGLASIFRNGKQQNFTMAASGGNATGKYRFSLGYFDQEGIIQKSDLKKYSGSFSANLKFLDSKRLGIDFNLISSQYTESIPLIRNEFSLVGDALTWNPTDSLRKSNGDLNIQPDNNNPLAVLEQYNDNSKVTTVLASLAPYYEFTDWLELKVLMSLNYGTGVRRSSIKDGLLPNSNLGKGTANIYNNENYTGQITNTLTFHKDVSPFLNITAIAGFEYMNFASKGSYVGVSGPASGFGNYGLDYTNYIQFSNSANRLVSSFMSPDTELQSYFGRSVFSYNSRYILTATFRADGSTKFGKDNKYGYFPSFSAAWIISEENFFKMDFVNFLKLRIGWGKTGNQEFPAGSSVALYGFTSNGGIGQINNPNPNLKWQADEQFDVGVDFTILGKFISGTIDYFRKTTTDLLFPSYPIQPSPPGVVVTWINLDGRIQNSGLEASIKAALIDHSIFSWDFGVNATFIQNTVSDLKAPIQTGTLHGGGMSGVTVQQIQYGAPMNSFYTRAYLGIDPSTGMSLYQDNGNTFYNVGNPNPTTLLGINTSIRYKKLSLTANLYGAFGQSIYNNTLNSTLSVANIGVGKNIPLATYQNPVKESLANPVTPSSRFIEKGDYLKMGNATLSYEVGKIGKALRQTRIYLTGQNLFTLTAYSGFNPEVNIDKSVNSVPSLGIDYQAYPFARTFIFGINFSL